MDYRLKLALAVVLLASGLIWAITRFNSPEGENEPFGAVSDEQNIKDFQEDYFARHGTYFQILSGKNLPSDATEAMKTKKIDIPDAAKNYAVDTHGYPNGTQGYTIRFIEPVISDSDTASSTQL